MREPRRHFQETVHKEGDQRGVKGGDFQKDVNEI